jgi:predicted acetyltransferase
MTQARQQWTVRDLTDADWDDFLAVDSHAFGSTMPSELIESERELLGGARSIGAYDGSTLAGIGSAFAYRLSVPGATVPAAAVTWVGVLPTYRRRGVLTALMTHQLHSVHDAGDEPLAILWASEPQIYGRFGYGLATRELSVKVPRDPRALHGAAPADPGLRLRLVDPADWKSLAGVYEAVAARRPGMPERDEPWWRRAVRDVPALRGSRSELRCVVAEDDTGVRGYALYATTQHFDENFGSGDVSVREVMAADSPALAAVYRYLFDLDLMGRTSLWNVPVDDPLLHWLQNPRRAKPSLGDGLYVRLVDLDRALEARTYAAPTDLVFDVTDTLCPWNAGRWRLTTGPDGAACRRTDDGADLCVDVSDLGAAYLGGTSLAELALAGRVVEQRPGGVAAASAAFAHSPAPWCPAVF